MAFCQVEPKYTHTRMHNIIIYYIIMFGDGERSSGTFEHCICRLSFIIRVEGRVDGVQKDGWMEKVLGFCL